MPYELQELLHTFRALYVAVIMWFTKILFFMLWKQVQNYFNMLQTKIILHYI